MVEEFIIRFSADEPAMMDLATQEGANAFLEQAMERDPDFFSKQWEMANQLRQKKALRDSLKHNKNKRRRGRSNSNNNNSNNKQLDCCYSILMHLNMNADTEVFRQYVTKRNTQEWIIHCKWILQELEKKQYQGFTRSNLTFMQSLAALMRHPVAVSMALYESTRVLSIGRLFARANNCLSSDLYAQSGVQMVDNLVICATRDFDNCWKPKRVFRKLNSDGLLELYLMWAAEPKTGSCQMKTNTLDMLKNQCSARFVKKIFQSGTPCGDVARRTLQDYSSVCKIALPYYVDLIKIADAPKKKQKKTPETCICQYCQKCDAWEKMAHCGRCETTYYCSRKCQRADWKRHKPNCICCS